MTQNNITLVKNSWALVAKMEMELVGGLFYNRLFEIMLEVKPMFNRTPLPEQSKKLLTMLSYIIGKLDKLDDILDEVTKLAKRHTQYGVKDEHYSAVGAALLWTLQQGLGKEWHADLELAWIEIFGTLSGTMITVQAQERNELVV